MPDPFWGLSSTFGFCCRFALAGKGNFHMTYSFLLIHVLIAASTALDKSPFFPPNLSMVLILSCFSSSSGRSTLIRPILNRLFLLEFLCTARRVKRLSNKRIANDHVSCLFLSSFFHSPELAYSHITVIAY